MPHQALESLEIRLMGCRRDRSSDSAPVSSSECRCLRAQEWPPIAEFRSAARISDSRREGRAATQSSSEAINGALQSSAAEAAASCCAANRPADWGGIREGFVPHVGQPCGGGGICEGLRQPCGGWIWDWGSRVVVVGSTWRFGSAQLTSLPRTKPGSERRVGTRAS